MSNPTLFPTPVIESMLMTLYSGLDLSDSVRSYRTALAHEYHRRTGKWFAARFY
jgi:hypothetical protein